MHRLEAEGSLKQVKGRWHLTPEIDYPAQGVNIRSASRRNYQVVLEGSGRIIETVDEGTAFSQAHPGAVYLHQGESFLVTELDMHAALVFVRPTDVDYYTQTNHVTDLRIVQVKEEKRSAGVAVYRGWVEVSNTIWGYKKKKRITEEFLGEEILDLPSQTYHTQALWFDIPIWAQDRIMREHVDFPGGLHAAEHAAIGLLPMFAMCDRADIGGLSTPMHMDTATAADIHLRRASGRSGDYGEGLRAYTGALEGHPRRPGRVPLQIRLPELHTIAEVRQQQRTPGQDRCAVHLWRPCWQNET